MSTESIQPVSHSSYAYALPDEQMTREKKQIRIWFILYRKPSNLYIKSTEAIKLQRPTRRTKLVISEPLRHYLVNIQPHHLKDVVLHLSIPATEKKQDMH